MGIEGNWRRGQRGEEWENVDEAGKWVEETRLLYYSGNKRFLFYSLYISHRVQKNK